MARLEQLAQLYSTRAQKAKSAQALVAQLREIIGDDARFARDVAKAITDGYTSRQDSALPTGTSQQRPAPVITGQTHFEKIRAFFKATGNEWATVDEIATAIGVRRNSFVGVMYSFHKDKFRQRKHPAMPKRRQWQLVEA